LYFWGVKNHAFMILFYNQDVTYKVCNRRAIKHWLNDVIVSEKHHQGDINIIFCSSDFLRNMNVRFLQHDYCTDVITFPYDDERHRVSGDVFIDIYTVNDNALYYAVPFENELLRVMVHGVLHLLDYNDGSVEESVIMKSKEDHYLSLFTEVYSERKL